MKSAIHTLYLFLMGSAFELCTVKYKRKVSNIEAFKRAAPLIYIYLLYSAQGQQKIVEFYKKKTMVKNLDIKLNV